MRAGLGSDLRAVTRGLFRNPGFTWAAVLTLAVAIGGMTAMLTVANAVLFRPLPFPDAERLVSLCERNPQVAGFCVGLDAQRDRLEAIQPFVVRDRSRARLADDPGPGGTEPVRPRRARDRWSLPCSREQPAARATLRSIGSEGGEPPGRPAQPDPLAGPLRRIAGHRGSEHTARGFSVHRHRGAAGEIRGAATRRHRSLDPSAVRSGGRGPARLAGLSGICATRTRGHPRVRPGGAGRYPGPARRAVPRHRSGLGRGYSAAA